MNNLIIIGNLTKDPESRSTNSGKTVCSFNVAVNRAGREPGEEAEYFTVVAWERLGENCAKFLAKGRKVAVSGPVSLKSYTTKAGEKRSYMEIRANGVEFLSAPQKTPLNANEGQSDEFKDVSTDDIPF